ncbi:MAG: gamma-glutamylcyclotransferase [Candidatus Lokiarchaeota archaeon]|nr:gamma-glutamylcyclotransferase [Candidatus Lokiarchaeota archaeon]
MNKNFSIIGYGTFITKGYWKDKENIEVCKVPGYRRIYPEGNWFPYVLKDKESSFWALKFDVSGDDLYQLDVYEGVFLGFYKRILIEINTKNYVLKKAYMYIPTEETVKKEKLSLEMDIIDKWKNEIKKNTEIIKLFPELLY